MKTIEKWRRNLARKEEAAWVRIRSQIRMAEWLRERHPDNTSWGEALTKAKNKITDTCGNTPVATLVEEVEAILTPFSKVAKTFKIHCVGHAHIDMNWMWGWPETVISTLDTFRTVLALMDEFPDFKFSQSQASVYEIARQFDPSLFEKIAQKIKEGRWEVTASHWVENDMNLASGEALVRHLLQTRSYMKKHFDLSPEDVPICWVPDSFGHAATVPNYLVQGGVNSVYMHRPGYEKQPVPEAFWWVGTDGSKVLVKNDQRVGYNSMIEPGVIFNIAKSMEENHGIKVTQIVYGVGDHGGGPTRRDLLMLKEMNSWSVYPTLVFSTTRAFFSEFEKLASDLPVLEGELNTELTGCYTTQALIKRNNRIGENRMLDVEITSALACATGTPVSLCDDFEKEFDESWQRVLFSHFHDILPGSCVRDTRLYCHGQFQTTMAFTSTATQRALRALAENVSTNFVDAGDAAPLKEEALFAVDGFGGGVGIGAVEGSFGSAHWHGLSAVRPFVVFNTTATDRTEYIEFMLWDRDVWETAAAFREERFHAVDKDGKVLKTQFTGLGHQWGHLYQRYRVRVTVPSIGYTAIAFIEGNPESSESGKDESAIFARFTTPPYHCSYMTNERLIMGMENDKISVRFNSETGRIVSFFDKVNNFEMVDPAIGIGPEYAVEHPGGHTAWSIYAARKTVMPTITTIREGLSGPFAVSVEVEYKIENSRVKFVYTLNAGETALGIDFYADWLEVGSHENGIPNLRFVVGTVLQDATPVYEIPFGELSRQIKTDREEPALRWAMLEATKEPVSLLVGNDCKYGHAVDGGAMRVNLIRSAYDPDPFPELGAHKAALLIKIVPSNMNHAAASEVGQAFNHPLFVVGTSVHEGSWPSESSFIRHKGEGIVFDCFKRAEDGKSFIFRCHNAQQKNNSPKIEFSPLLGKLADVESVDLLERPDGNTASVIEYGENWVMIDIASKSIASFRVKFE